MIYETNLKNLLAILTAAKIGGFNVKADSTTLQRAWSYAYVNIEDKIPEKSDDIAFLKKEEFLKLLQRTAPEEIEESGNLTNYYRRILKQALKLGLLKPIYETDINNIKNKKDKIFIQLEKGIVYFFVGFCPILPGAYYWKALPSFISFINSSISLIVAPYLMFKLCKKSKISLFSVSFLS